VNWFEDDYCRQWPFAITPEERLSALADWPVEMLL
jgi:hypothetical protein